MTVVCSNPITKAIAEPALLYLEHRCLRIARVIASGPKRYRVTTEEGPRRIGRERILLEGEFPLLENLVKPASELASTFVMSEIWQVADGKKQTATELATKLACSDNVVGSLAIHIAHACDPAFFRIEEDGYLPVSAKQVQTVTLARQTRRKAQQQLHKQLKLLAKSEVSQDLRDQALAYLQTAHDVDSEAFKILRRFSLDNKQSIAQLCLRWKLVADAQQLHIQTKLAKLPPARPDCAAPTIDLAQLALIADDGFSIDSDGTTEIDDAFSVQPLDDDHWRIGIHIAAPALGLAPDAWRQVNERMTTIYLANQKYTCLPPLTIADYALIEGKVVPTVSLIQDIELASGKFSNQQFLLGKAKISRNYDLAKFTDWQFGQQLNLEHDQQLAILAKASKLLPAGRSEKAYDRSFLVKLDSSGEPEFTPRRQLAAIDYIVASLMVYYNVAAAKTLREAKVPRLLRRNGRTIAVASSQEVDQEYAWATSPLRRIIDLCNQQQLHAVLSGSQPVWELAQLRELANKFDAVQQQAYSAQHALERYWALYWLSKHLGDLLDAKLVADGGSAELVALPVTVKLDNPSANHVVGDLVKIVISEVDLVLLQVNGEIA